MYDYKDNYYIYFFISYIPLRVYYWRQIFFMLIENRFCKFIWFSFSKKTCIYLYFYLYAPLNQYLLYSCFVNTVYWSMYNVLKIGEIFIVVCGLLEGKKGQLTRKTSYCTLWVLERALAPRGSSFKNAKLQRRRATTSYPRKNKEKSLNASRAAQNRNEYLPDHHCTVYWVPNKSKKKNQNEEDKIIFDGRNA